MELQFQKNAFPCLQTVAREIQTQEQTLEVRLTDDMPDIGRVLTSWGQVILRSKEWRSGSMHISGGVMVWTLYMPEDGGAPQSVESWLPMQMKWDFPATEKDGTICAMPLLRGVDARCISARKMMVRASVSVLAEAKLMQEVEICCPGEMPSDIQLLKKTYPILLPKEAGEKPFSLDVDIALPAAAPAMEKLICYTLRPALRESKFVGDKLVFRGIATVHLCYYGTDGNIHCWDLEVPFSQYAELDADYNENTLAQISFALTGLELEPALEENLTLRAGLTGQYTIYDREDTELAVDAYSLGRSVRTQIKELNLPAVLEMKQEQKEIEKNIESGIVNSVDATFYPEHPRVIHENNRVEAELSGVLQVLGYNADGQLESSTSRWDENWSMLADNDTGVELTLQAYEPPVLSGYMGTMQLNTQMQMDIMTIQESAIPMLAGIEIGDEVEQDPDRPSVILRRCYTDSLWQLAKECGSTVEAIQKANHLQEEPVSGQMLLIPVL